MVQLLLNQKILLFRKGRVSTSPNLAYADLDALAALSVASKPHTPLLSTTKGPQGQIAAQQLKTFYLKMKQDIDELNVKKGLAGANRPMEIHPLNPLTEPIRPTHHPIRPVSSSSSINASASSWPVGMNKLSQTQSLSDSQWSVNEKDIWSNSTDALQPVFTSPMLSSSSSETSQTERPKPQWLAAQPDQKPANESYVHVLAHKFLMSKWGPSSAQLARTQRFPFAPLWHLELTGTNRMTR